MSTSESDIEFYERRILESARQYASLKQHGFYMEAGVKRHPHQSSNEGLFGVFMMNIRRCAEQLGTAEYEQTVEERAALQTQIDDLKTRITALENA